MSTAEFAASRRFADTPYGRIAYVERGEGPAALFCHGAFLNAYQWRDVIDRCAPARRCIAFDNLGHGHTEVGHGQAVDFGAQAAAAAALLDALGVDRADLVGNDSGGAIAQVFAARHPERVRSLCLTNCDVYTNSPPALFQTTIEAIRTLGGLEVCSALLSSVRLARSRRGFGLTYERPEELSGETLAAYLGPLVATPEKAAVFDRFVLDLAPRHTVEIAGALRRLEAPTLIAWGADDPFFELKWAYWLAGAIPGARPVVEVPGARLFWPEERPSELGDLLLGLWGS
ncbi:MAG TPA: alpha/beta hydrolase [Terriglobales bacterium]|nr:alpha/beta hydrolase [Terriglobales bacterium]